MKPPKAAASPSPEEERPAPLESRLLQAFLEAFPGPPSLLVRAPGRVNLLGEHTDYNEGFVLPMAIDRSIGIALRPREDRRVIVRSLDFGEERTFDLDQLQHANEGWIEYVKGTAWAVGEAEPKLRGWEGVLAGEIPQGAGLSSSAALEIATARAFAAVSNVPWDPRVAARWAQRAENGWVGVHCGIMDQLVVAGAAEGHALLIDCRNLRTSPQPLPPGTVVVVLDTSTRRGLTGSAYNDRRAGCEEAARLLGVRSLRDVDSAELEVRCAELPATLRGLVRHVVGENARTLAAAEAMTAGDAVHVGELMAQSHRSLRDDFCVSSDALDAMVVSARESEGCHGARMTGAGFGGCVVALVDAARSRDFTQMTEAAYRKRTGLEPALYACEPSAGVSLKRLG